MSDQDLWGTGTEGIADDIRIFWVLLVTVRKFDHRLREYVSLAPARCSDTAPEVLGREGIHIKPSHDAKVSRATLERSPEIGVRFAISVDDIAVREDDFKVCNIVAGQAVEARIVRITSPGQKAAYAHIAVATAGDADRMVEKLLVDIAPRAPGWSEASFDGAS